MNKSFTLIEILVVIVVIGIISSFIIVGLSSVSDKANIAKGQAFSNSLRNSLLMNLVSEWKLDGNANDSWGVNNGTLVGPTHLPVLKTGSDCISGSCYSFDGTEDYIDCGGSVDFDLTSTFTLNAWIKLISVGSYSAIISKGSSGVNNPYFLAAHSNNNIYLGIRFTNLGYKEKGIGSFSINKWHNVIGIYDGINMYGYVDGVMSSKTPWTDTIITLGQNLQLGGRISTSYSWFNGLIDDILIYNQAISTSKVKQNYYSGLSTLVVNRGIDNNEYINRLAKLKNNMVQNNNL